MPQDNQVWAQVSVREKWVSEVEARHCDLSEYRLSPTMYLGHAHRAEVWSSGGLPLERLGPELGKGGMFWSRTTKDRVDTEWWTPVLEPVREALERHRRQMGSPDRGQSHLPCTAQ